MFGPTIAPVEEKLWGRTRRIYDCFGVSSAHASIVPGGYSSRHKHVHKGNVFYVVEGTLLVEIYEKPEDKPFCVYKLQPGQPLRVPAGTWHRFIAASMVELIEMYDCPVSGHQPSPEDIVRYDEGGVDLSLIPV